MNHLKKFFVILLTLTILFTPKVNASENDIDWTKPVRVQLIGHEGNNKFIAQSNNEKFEISMIGIDIADEYKLEKLEKNDKNEETFKEQNIYYDLLKSNNIIIELDSKENKYNNEGIIHAWFWTNGELFQAKLLSEGRAKIDEQLCSYSRCNKYYDILLAEQEYAKKLNLGLWRSEDVQYSVNVGGADLGMQIDMTMLAYIMMGVAGLLFLILIMVLIKNSKKNKKKVAKTSKKLEEKAADITQEINTYKKENNNNLEKKVIPEKPKDFYMGNTNKKNIEEHVTAMEELSEEKREEMKTLLQPTIDTVINTIEKQNKQKSESTKNDNNSLGTINLSENMTLEEAGKKVIEDLKNEINNKDIKNNDTTIDDSEIEIIEDKNISEQNNSSEAIVNDKTSDSKNKNFDVLLKTVTTVFDSKDARSKETPEVISLEYAIVNDKLEFDNKKILVKPMRNSQLTDSCIKQSKISQDEIDKAYFLDEKIKDFIKDVENCKNVYVWGNASIKNLVEDCKQKLTEEDMNKIEKISAKTINYKNDFAKRQGIEPCGLVKVMEMFNFPQMESMLQMMEYLYKAERE